MPGHQTKTRRHSRHFPIQQQQHHQQQQAVSSSSSAAAAAAEDGDEEEEKEGEEFELVVQRIPLRNPWVASESSSTASISSRSTVFPSHRVFYTGEIQTTVQNVASTAIQPVVLPAALLNQPAPPVATVYNTGAVQTHSFSWTHCCSMFVQSLLIGAALTGVALIISGISLDTQYGGQLIVLVYIGALLSLVSVILLVIHCYMALKHTRPARIGPLLPRSEIQV